MPSELPEGIVSILDKPGFVDHLTGQRIRIIFEVYSNESWHRVFIDEGTEAWLCEYPPNSSLIHYVILGKSLEVKKASTFTTEENM
jgi:hypothetical protein